jgi:hypothetical protein
VGFVWVPLPDIEAWLELRIEFSKKETSTLETVINLEYFIYDRSGKFLKWMKLLNLFLGYNVRN